MAIMASSPQQHNPEQQQQQQRRRRNYRSHHHRPKQYSNNISNDNDRTDCSQRYYATNVACCCLMVSLLLLLPSSTTTNHATTTTTFPFPLVVLATSTGGSSSSSSSGTNSLPRSRSRHHPPVSSTTLHQYHEQEQPLDDDTMSSSSSASSSSILTNARQQQQQLWNPSPLIDPMSGLLKYIYQRIPGEWEMEMKLRRTKNTIIESSSATSVSSSSSLSSTTSSNTKAKAKPTTPIINNSYCQIRQVPGDGNCLFHSISFGLNYVTNRTHYDLSTTTADSMPHNDDTIENRREEYSLSGKASTGLRKRLARKQQPTLHDLYIQSQSLRDQCVQYIRKYMTSYYGYGSKKLYLQGSEYINCKELIDAAAQQYNITAVEYCNSMAEDSVWGGGPEIVVLCNLLQRPIHVYELTTTTTSSSSSLLLSDNGNHNKDQQKYGDHFGNDHMKLHSSTQQQQQQHQPAFVLRRMACFGSPKFDYRDAIHILSADSRFPDLRPGQQLRAGNHFLAVFPIQRNQPENDDDDDDDDPNQQRHRRKRIRRGGDSSITDELPIDENKMSQRNGNLPILKTMLTPFNNLLYNIIIQYIHWWNDIMQRFI